MKKVIFALCMFFGGVAVVNAQDTTSTDQSQNQNQYSDTPQGTETDDTGMTPDMGLNTGTNIQGDRVRIQSQDLPDAIKRSLEGQEYRGWLVNGAYKAQGVSSTDPSGQTGSTSTTGTTADPNNSSTSGNAGVGASGEEIFVVELKNGAQTKTVRFDKEGNKLDDMEDQGGDQK